jgi:SAM-dependent methyltransferase
LADICNKAYNPIGRLAAADYRFPFEDRKFDFVFLASVFTHMLRNDVDHYFSEISRILKPGGRCFITWFLLNEQSKHLIERGCSTLQFAHPIDGCVTTDPKVPEWAVSYEEADVLALYAQHGITLSRPIQYGWWCGRTECLDYQDMCIGYKG